MRLKAKTAGLALALLVMLIGAPLTVLAAPSAKQPRLDVPAAVYNFGAVSQGVPVKHTFKIINRGDADLIIGSVQTTCGCTVAQPAKKLLRPGESTEITATLDTSHERGRVDRRIDVYTNDPKTPDKALTLAGMITVQAEAVPAEVNFKKVRRDAGASRQVEIKYLGKKAAGFRVTKFSNSNPAIKVTRTATPSGAAAGLEIKVLPSMPVGAFQDVVEVATSWRPIEVPVYGRVVGDLRTEPAQVSFGILPHGQGAVRYVRVINAGSKPVAIKAVTSSNSAVSAQAKALEQGKEFRITLRLKPGLPDGQLQGQLKITTDDPSQPSLTVPYFGVVGSFKG